MRILYIHSTLVPPPKDQSTDRFFLLSKDLTGDVLQPIWTRNPEHILAAYGPESYPVYSAGRFRYHWILERPPGIRRTFYNFWFCLRQGLKIHRENRIDCIVVYSHMTTALFGLILKLFTGAKLIVEIVTAPELVYITERAQPTWRNRLMKMYSDLCLHVFLLLGDRAHLLFPSQLAHYPLLKRVRRSVFHEFVPTSIIQPLGPSEEQSPTEPYLLLVGAPWYLKGADRVIAAFRALASDFPGVKLKIIGHYPDGKELRALTGGLPQIEIIKAMHYREIVETIRHALVLMLPSRCEGTPRVIMEAMAAGVPVVGSDAGGIPYLIRDGETGFVAPRGDPKELEKRMRQLITDGELRKRLGQNAARVAHGAWNEEAYVEEFTWMVAAAVNGLP